MSDDDVPWTSTTLAITSILGTLLALLGFVACFRFCCDERWKRLRRQCRDCCDIKTNDNSDEGRRDAKYIKLASGTKENPIHFIQHIQPGPTVPAEHHTRDGTQGGSTVETVPVQTHHDGTQSGSTVEIVPVQTHHDGNDDDADDDEGASSGSRHHQRQSSQGNGNADDDEGASSSTRHHQQQPSQEKEEEEEEEEERRKRKKEDVLVRKYLLKQQQQECINAGEFTPAILNTRYPIYIADIFTDLDLLKEHKLKQAAKPTTLEEVLGIIKSTPACKVLIEGEGGIGKTTLLKYIAYNWAKESDETFKDKIVFLVNIRDMDKGEDILDAIVKQMKLKTFHLKTYLPKDPKLIERFIINHDDEIVLLLDGLDELRDGTESPIILFNKKELKNSKVILTCRSEKIDEFSKKSSVHVKVKGFNAVSIRKYIKKHFKFVDEEERGDSLIRELNIDQNYKWSQRKQHKEVYSMCTIPLFLFSVCTMWEENPHIPADKTDLFKQVFRCILNQFIEKEHKNETISMFEVTKKITKFEKTPKRFVNAMLVLGKCMYEGLKRNQLSIKKIDLIGEDLAVAALALKLGFVYQDAPSSKSEFEEIFRAPHKLIVESLVGFYLYKRCQVDPENVPLEDSGILKPINENDGEVIRDNPYLVNTRLFAIGFLGADAWKIFKHWITNGFSTFRSLMPYFEIVKKEHRILVEKALIGHMTKEDFKMKPHINNICNSLRRFTRHINPSVEVNEGEHLITLMRRFHDMDPMPPVRLEYFFKENSSEESGKILAHILVAVRDQAFILGAFHESYAAADDDHVKSLTSECHKLNFKYDIKVLDHSITASCLVHVLNNTPQLEVLSLKSSNCVNAMIKECSCRKDNLKLVKLCIGGNNLSDIDSSSFTSLLVIFPKLEELDMHSCSLSCVIMNDMIEELCREGVNLELVKLCIRDNDLSDLSNIDSSSFTSLLAIAPKLKMLDMKKCSLSGVIMNDMIRACCSRGVKLELRHLDISENNLSDIKGCLLASLLVIAAGLYDLNMSDCSVSNRVMDDMVRCPGFEVGSWRWRGRWTVETEAVLAEELARAVEAAYAIEAARAEAEVKMEEEEEVAGAKAAAGMEEAGFWEGSTRVVCIRRGRGKSGEEYYQFENEAEI